MKLELLDFNPRNLPWGQRCKLIVPDRRDESGKRICKWCDGQLPPRRTSWCSSNCADAAWLRMNWSALRRYIVHRDKTCRICDAKSWHAGEVDHIVAVIDGGTDDPKNLRLLCVPCHKAVTAAQAKARSDRRKSA